MKCVFLPPLLFPGPRARGSPSCRLGSPRRTLRREGHLSTCYKSLFVCHQPHRAGRLLTTNGCRWRVATVGHELKQTSPQTRSRVAAQPTKLEKHLSNFNVPVLLVRTYVHRRAVGRNYLLFPTQLLLLPSCNIFGFYGFEVVLLSR